MTLSLDDAQRRLLDAPTTERRVVIAGPGAGKTTASIELAREIGDRQSPTGDDRAVLFVSFSRAAMAAAFTSFGSTAEPALVDVAAMTLDSLAWQLTETSGDPHGPEPDFENVIRRATEKLRSDYDEEIDAVAHLIVDEAQDMSTVRRDFLYAIIDRLPDDAGVTVFGDPLQSIYEFLDTASDGVESAWESLVAGLAARSITATYVLDGAHRARRRGPKKVAAVIDGLRSAGSRQQVSLLDDLITDLTHLEIGEFVADSRGWTGTTAVLTRTNLDATHLFETIASAGVACGWNEPGRPRPRVAPWVAQLWASVDGNPLTRRDFMVFAASGAHLDSEWFRLMLTEGDGGDSVDWQKLVRSLRAGVDPSSPWYVVPESDVLVSTIHQSKGLEWDNVAVVDAEGLLRDVGCRDPETELLSVALSRARDRVVVVDWRSPFTKSRPGGGLRYVPHPKNRQPTAVQLTPDVIRTDKPSGGREAQQVLGSCDRNAPVEFDLLESGAAEWPTYRCRIEGTTVGVTSKCFGRRLAAVAGRPHRWPSLGSVPTDGVETVWATSNGLQMWLVPRPFGMAEVTWGAE
ncbi:AAA family ATPase [Gordonia sp. CPCC 206044]|uniref:AAA family ATPase n=1 Tax=Gordonia sp. CPCC 206044 TaxID=3140793 RepID=UPI003AF3C7B3